MRRVLQAILFVGLLVFCLSEPARAQIESLDTSILTVETGGHWEAGGQSGTIRLVVTTAGYDHLASTLHAQWLVDATATNGRRLVRSVSVKDIPPGVWVLESPLFELVDQQWRATIAGTNPHTSPAARQKWVLTFGAPGDVQARTTTISN
jgi:hypothetical protein